MFKSCPNQFKIANLRYFNPAGAHESGFIGEDPKGKTNNLFPIINKVAHGKINCLKVFGNDWETNDGTCVRDFIHVMDLVDAHISTMEYLNLNESQILNLNLGRGKGISIKDLIMIYEKINNCIIPIEFHDRRRGDTAEVVADISKALSLLNWKPRKTLEDICRDAFNFEKNKQSIKY